MSGESETQGHVEITVERAERLTRRVVRCRQRAASLAETLEAEAESLTHRELDEFPELLRRKAEQVGALEESERQLSRLLQEYGLPSGQAGARLLLRHAPADLSAAWQELEQLLRAIQARNEANGRLIYRNLEHTRRLLDLVTGGEQRAEELTYGTTGSHGTGPRGRKITQA